MAQPSVDGDYTIEEEKDSHGSDRTPYQAWMIVATRAKGETARIVWREPAHQPQAQTTSSSIPSKVKYFLS